MSIHLILIGWSIGSIVFALIFSPWLKRRLEP